MQTGRNRGLEKPEALSEHQARQREWGSIRGYHQGQWPKQPRTKAGHMTAPDRLAQTLIKILAKRGRPHMTTPLDAFAKAALSLSRNSKTSPGKPRPLHTWKIFLRNHVEEIASIES